MCRPQLQLRPCRVPSQEFSSHRQVLGARPHRQADEVRSQVRSAKPRKLGRGRREGTPHAAVAGFLDLRSQATGAAREILVMKASLAHLRRIAHLQNERIRTLFWKTGSPARLGSKRSTSPPACRETSTIQSYLDRCAEQSCMIIKYP